MMKTKAKVKVRQIALWETLKQAGNDEASPITYIPKDSIVTVLNNTIYYDETWTDTEYYRCNYNGFIGFVNINALEPIIGGR